MNQKVCPQCNNIIGDTQKTCPFCCYEIKMDFSDKQNNDVADNKKFKTKNVSTQNPQNPKDLEINKKSLGDFKAGIKKNWILFIVIIAILIVGIFTFIGNIGNSVINEDSKEANSNVQDMSEETNTNTIDNESKEIVNQESGEEQENTEQVELNQQIEDNEQNEMTDAIEYAEEFVFPDSDRRFLNEDEVMYLDYETLRTAINEIYARHGYVFKSAEWNNYFNKTSWYIANPACTDQNYVTGLLNEYEKDNIKLLSKYRELKK